LKQEGCQTDDEISALRARIAELESQQSKRAMYRRLCQFRKRMNEAEAALSAVSQAAADVLAERRRQIEAEGWTPEHDDEHANGEMGRAAACYAAYHGIDAIDGMNILPALWPKAWSLEWWKPRDAHSNLVRAGALILAEIERLDRAAQAERED